MCNSVRYAGREYQSPRELAQLVGGVDHLVWLDNRPGEMNSCLCPVDLEATLGHAGFRWERGADPMEWTAFKGT
ncbi:hypothetical protein BJ122_11737 [Rhodopseudomonas faecalis]|uniref:Uncharacterized protein n=1 Tax=Rhodopseudomonas faecalis TaxID=99655 RepID=A0A318TAS7_9BRAD|nr:hypothetical protein BJ122_11737 [Rhodopseudomonas faecalis]